MANVYVISAKIGKSRKYMGSNKRLQVLTSKVKAKKIVKAVRQQGLGKNPRILKVNEAKLIKKLHQKKLKAKFY